MSHQRNGPAEWRPSRSDEVDSGDDDGEEGRDSSPQPQAAKRRRAHAPEHVPQDSSSEPGTTSRPANAVSRLGGFGINKPKAPQHDFFDLTSQQSDDFDDEDEGDEDSQNEKPSSPDAPQREPGRRGRPPGSTNKKPKQVKEAPTRGPERPRGAPNKKPRTDKRLLTSSMTLASGSAEHRDSDLDEGDNDDGLPLPPHDAVPKSWGKKTGVSSAEPPPLYIEQHGLDALMVGQPCAKHIPGIEGSLPTELTFHGDDIAVLDQAVDNNSSLSKLMQILWSKFQGRLYDLFKFGLWPDVKGPGDGAKSNTTQVGRGRDAFTVVNPYPSGQFTKNLRQLATHVIWEDDMDKFRYVLMYAVSCRVEGHDAPVLPILPLDGQLLNGLGVPRQNMAMMRYRNSQENGLASRGRIKLLCDEIKNSVEPHEPRDELERSLLLLSASDVRVVIKALDKLWDVTTKHKLYQSTEWYYEKWDDQKLLQWPRVKPRDNRPLWKHLQQTVIRMRGEHTVRQALERVDGAYLYDVCEEHCPLTAECLDDIKPDEEGGLTQSQLDVVRGLVRPKYGLHLEADAWRIPEDQHVPPTTRGPRKKAGPAAPAAPSVRASTTSAAASRREATFEFTGQSRNWTVRPTEVAESPRLDGQPSDSGCGCVSNPPYI